MTKTDPRPTLDYRPPPAFRTKAGDADPWDGAAAVAMLVVGSLLVVPGLYAVFSFATFGLFLPKDFDSMLLCFAAPVTVAGLLMVVAAATRLRRSADDEEDHNATRHSPSADD